MGLLVLMEVADLVVLAVKLSERRRKNAFLESEKFR